MEWWGSTVFEGRFYVCLFLMFSGLQQCSVRLYTVLITLRYQRSGTILQEIDVSDLFASREGSLSIVVSL